MKRFCGRLMLAGVFFGAISLHLSASINFGSRDSAISIGSGSRFNISSNNLSIDGTFQEGLGAIISGNPMSFDNGVLSSGTLEALIDGEYDPIGLDFVRLQGNGRFRAEPGTLIQGLTVEGTGNSIEGQPQFSGPITLIDNATEVSMAIQSRLNQNIILNGGTVTLNDDLRLEDNVTFSDDGVVDLNGRQLNLGSFYAQPWANSLYLNNAIDITLNGKVSLTGSWTFGGNSTLNGNGAELDLSGGGQLIVDNGASLSINDIFITGLGDTAGQIILRNGASQILTSDSTYKLNDNFTINQGQMIVEGPTTFALGQKNWTFDGNSNLTVDGVSLWLDYLDSPCMPGTLNAPLPVNNGINWNGPNLALDLSILGNLSLINRGTVKELVDANVVGFDPVLCELMSGTITGTLILSECICLGPDATIRVTSNATINGQGTVLDFTDPDHSQLSILPGGILTLENITLRNINSTTFDIRPGGYLLIGENVVWELDQDITWSTGILHILQTSAGANVFTLEGDICRRVFDINPLVPTLSNGLPNLLVELGHNTIILESVELSGLEYIAFSSDSFAAASIALVCNAAVDVTQDTAMNFFAEGQDNDLFLRQDGINLFGNIIFGEAADNELHVRFNFATQFNPLTPGRVAPNGDNVLANFPVVQLSGNPGMYLYSSTGIAHLFFEDFNAAVRCNNSNAFGVDDNSILTFKNLQILSNPIEQFSALFRFEGFQLLDQQIDPGFIRFPSGIAKPNMLITALHLQRQRAYEQFEQDKKSALAVAKAKAKAKPRKSQRREFDIEIDLDRPDFDSDYGSAYRGVNMDKETAQMIEDYIASLETRSLNLPTMFDQHFGNSTITPSTPTSGNIEFNQTIVNNFMTQVGLPFNIVLKDGATLIQGHSDVTVGASQVINIVGTNNVIKVTHTMTINPNTLFFGKDAELTFVAVNNGATTPKVIFTDGTVINLERNCILRFDGEGHAIFNNNSGLMFKGKKTVNPLNNTSHVAYRPRLIVTNGSELTTASDVRFTGVGSVEVTKNGTINPGQGKIIFGLDTPTDPSVIPPFCPDMFAPSVDTNDFKFNVFDNGQVILDSKNGRISFRYGTSHISFDNGGSLFITHGSFEINADGLAVKPGLLKDLSFRGGSLFIGKKGLLSMASNNFNANNGQPYPLAYDGLLAIITGNPQPGQVRFVANPATHEAMISPTFAGPLNPASGAFNNFGAISVLQLVNFLLNQ